MTCTKCRTNFCWLCQSRLPKQNPYLHFNMTTSPCFNQLFHGSVFEEEEDDDDDDDDFIALDDGESDDEMLLLQYL